METYKELLEYIDYLEELASLNPEVGEKIYYTTEDLPTGEINKYWCYCHPWSTPIQGVFMIGINDQLCRVIDVDVDLNFKIPGPGIFFPYLENVLREFYAEYEKVRLNYVEYHGWSNTQR